ncbi:hypothetical protein CAPTEDRAFT_191992 [Capitella teleta]|uniref:Ion transport domain-containing protein n=1 Tax=Capitella teleta TaxID=283909 RepID=R7THL8_CAPTE|nr:hypothetical protein CAPTEDRAFT_191992 [Capitella teleta]|eukprot:ELT90605.1 hypothetical protein CAPTEDRAFT_191992 [Capitella teleta]
MKHRETWSVGELSESNCGIAEDRLLPLEKYSWWFNAICANDTAVAMTALEGHNKDHLINGYFTYPHEVAEESAQIECPASLAVCHGSFNLLRLLMNHSSAINFINRSGENVVHDMINLSGSNPEDEEGYVESYKQMVELVGTERMKDLLRDQTSLPPLELSCMKQTMHFTKAIFETKGVYLVKEEITGMSLHRWFDCSDYEALNGRPAKRSRHSPVKLLAMMSKKSASLPQTRELFLSDPVTTWSHSVARTNTFPLVLWFLFRFAHFICYILFDLYASGFTQQYVLAMQYRNMNDTAKCGLMDTPSNNTLVGLMSYTLAVCSFVIIFDISDLLAFLWNARPSILSSISERFFVASNIVFYRSAQFVCVIMLICGLSLTYTAQGVENTLSLLDMSYVFRLIGTLLSAWSLLFFLQMVPGIGVFVIIILHMLADLVSFLVVFFAFMFPFSHIFMVYMKSAALPPCNPLFSDYITSMYSSFLVMLNSLGLATPVHSPIILALIHFSYTFAVSIMLINFLIALFSNTVAVVMVDKDIYFMLEKLVICSTVQSRVMFICPCVRRLLLWMTKHCFVEFDGRVCIKCVSPVGRLRSRERSGCGIDDNSTLENTAKL